MADLPTPPKIKIAQYADDTAIYSTSTHPRVILKYLQEGTNTLLSWFKKWQLKSNETKTETIYFKRRPSRIPNREIHAGTQPCQWKDTVKYLGVHLDKKLPFRTHLVNMANKGRQVLGAIYPLLNRNSPMSIKNKLRIYKALIRPTLTYGHELYRLAAITYLLQIQTVQNKTLRIITGMSVMKLYTETQEYQHSSSSLTVNMKKPPTL